MDSVLAVSSAQVISEILDGEAVIINLDTGCYFSLDPLASQIWDAVAAGGATAEGIARALAAAYGTPVEDAGATLAPFLERLSTEGLVVAAPGPKGAPLTFPKVSDRLGAPTLSRFDDIQDLLLLDPIHEVAESGWPARKTVPDAEPE